MYQRTVNEPRSLGGFGLHTGEPVEIIIQPAEPDTGIVFKSGCSTIPAHFSSILDTNYCTTLGNEFDSVKTVEHIMAAFYGLGIDNAYVYLGGPEIPIFDGSAGMFMQSLAAKQQDAKRKYLRITKPFVATIDYSEKMVSFLPTQRDVLDIRLSLDFKSNLVHSSGHVLSLEDVQHNFENELSRARTFGFLEDKEYLQEQGLALGASSNTSIIIENDEVDSLRYPDEFIRHKMLDLVGDLFLGGYRILGKVHAHCPGHTLNTSAIKQLVKSGREYAEIVTL